jgi:putative sugar O-methyltransferase
MTNATQTPLSNTVLAELDVLLNDMTSAPELYRPTQFWENSSKSIVEEFKQHGLEHFKGLHSSRMWFVPNYGKYRETPARLLRKWQASGRLPKHKLVRRLEDYLSGRLQAVADYRVAKAAFTTPHPFLRKGESVIGDGLLHSIDGAAHSKASLNYLRGLAFLQRVPGYAKNPATSFLEIGGGFGSLGEILLQSGTENRYVDIDIPPVLSSATYYLKTLFGADNIASYGDTKGQQRINLDTLLKTKRAATLPTWQLESLQGGVDCFVNFVSFQEMEPHVVQNYISKVQPLTRKYVVLRNSTYGKRLATSADGIGVQQATTLDMMINWFSEFELVARDSLVFGDESRFGKFRSEVAVLRRK